MNCLTTNMSQSKRFVIHICLIIEYVFQAQFHLESQYFQPYSAAPLQPASSYPSAPPNYPTNGSLYPAIDSPKPSQSCPVVPNHAVNSPNPSQSYPVMPNHVYPSLSDYMGLELTPDMIAANMPEYIGTVAVQPPVS